MPRHKKTKEQKIRADLLRKAEPVDISYTPTFTFSSTQKELSTHRAITKSSWLFSDLKRTVITSSSIVVAELILFFLLSTHIIR